MPDPTPRGPRTPDAEAPEEPTEVGTDDLELEPPPSRPGGPWPGWARTAAIAAAVAVAAGAALAYRSYHRSRVLAEGTARADALLRLDTHAGYQQAARLLEPLARLDPIGAGARRAFALAMLFADYREPAANEAETFLVEPGRAREVPEEAQLAYAALALGRTQGADATTYASRSRSPTGQALQARAALLFDNLGAAGEPLEGAVRVDPTLPIALALRGDVLRREQKAAEARRCYLDALAASPGHARAAFGLGKLALSGKADPAEARTALARILDDREGTPQAERARAALHLAPLLARIGDRAGAAAAIDSAGLDPAGRAWLEKAAAEEELHRGAYRVIGGAPARLLSASDDDPYVAPPAPPPRAERAAPPPRKVKAAAKNKPKKKVAKKGAKAKAAKKPAKKPAQPAPPRKDQTSQ